MSSEDKDKKLRELLAHWDAKLAESGFKDLEHTSTVYRGKIYRYDLRFPSENISMFKKGFRDSPNVLRERKINHSQRAENLLKYNNLIGNFLFRGTPLPKIHHFILKQHNLGHSLRKIQAMLLRAPAYRKASLWVLSYALDYAKYQCSQWHVLNPEGEYYGEKVPDILQYYNNPYLKNWNTPSKRPLEDVLRYGAPPLAIRQI